jgi:hypothetical protein
MSADRNQIVGFPPGSRALRRNRSRVTNHKDLLPNLDGRSSAARRFRDLVNSYLADQGGIEHCSEIRMALIRRLASIVVQSELLEARMVNGEQIDVGQLCTLASTTVRIASRLGLQRRSRDVTPDPIDYAKSVGAVVDTELKGEQ